MVSSFLVWGSLFCVLFLVFLGFLLEDLGYLFSRIFFLDLVDCIFVVLFIYFFIFVLFRKLVVRLRGLIGVRFSFFFGENISSMVFCFLGFWRRAVVGWLRSFWRARLSRIFWFRWRSLRVSWEVFVSDFLFAVFVGLFRSYWIFLF